MKRKLSMSTLLFAGARGMLSSLRQHVPAMQAGLEVSSVEANKSSVLWLFSLLESRRNDLALNAR